MKKNLWRESIKWKTREKEITAQECGETHAAVGTQPTLLNGGWKTRKRKKGPGLCWYAA